MSDWEMLTDKNRQMLEDSVDLRQEFAHKLKVFQSGLIPEKDRKWQFAAHSAYDEMSYRERQVFNRRLNLMTFPHIAEGLDISVSSAKTYWRRALMKCEKFFNVN
jgi:DNA-binding CsgD family transcriptional regulator